MPKRPNTRAASGLTDLEDRFCVEYLVDLKASQAYMRASPGAKPASARVQASRLLARPNIQDRIAELRAELARKTGLTPERLINEAWNIVQADPRELMEYRVGCCRYCHGKSFFWQRTDAEFKADKAKHAKEWKEAKPDERKTLGEFDEKGGPGFNMGREVNPQCPMCAGEGEGRVLLHDTRNVSAAALSLLAGVKITEKGTEIKVHNKQDAMDKLMRHFGLYNDTLTIKPKVSIKDFTGKKGRGD
jgi:phage terminase small subunit